MKGKYSTTIFIAIGLIIFTLLSWYLYNLVSDKQSNNVGNNQQNGQLTTASPIPPSSEGAKQYIDQAMALADQKKYDEALAILKTALQQYPDDQNIKLDLEYIENLKRKNVQR